MSEKRGAPKGNVNAVKLTIPTSGSIGPAPTWFCAERVRIWDEIVSSIQPDLIGRNDRTTLEVLVNLMWKYRFQNDEFTSADYNMLHKYQTSMCLSPVARSKVKQAKSDDTKPVKKNDFEEF